jgi:hypothetical protein
MEQVVGHEHAAGAGHVLHHNRRLARNVILPVPCDQPADQIDTTTGRGRDRHLHRLTGIECRDIVICMRREPTTPASASIVRGFNHGIAGPLKLFLTLFYPPPAIVPP